MRLIIGVLISLLLIGAASADHFLLGQVIYVPPPGAVYLSAVNLEVPSLNSGLNTTIPNGGTATLTWDSAGAGSCTGTGFSTGGSVGIGSVTVSPTSGVNTYSVNCGGAVASATVTVSGTRRDAAATYCAANGGGTGASGSPWHDTCIQAAITAASSGDTVFLAAGNWAFSYSTAAVITAKGINLVGAGSGNTFDAVGHPNNPTWNNTGTFTRVYQSSSCVQPNCQTTRNGYLEFANCTAGPTVAHIFFDGSVNTAGGDDWALLDFNNCSNVNVNDIRLWAYKDPTYDPETQFFVYNTSNNSTIQNSIFSEPPVITGGSYPGSQIFQVQLQTGMLVKNNIFYMNTGNPIYMDNVTWTGNYTNLRADSLGGAAVIPVFGPGGCSNAGCYNGDPNGQTSGSFHWTAANNIFDGGGPMGVGGGINDPSTAGILNDQNWTGNWVLGTDGIISSCSGHVTSVGYCATNTSGVSGMQINLPGNGYSFNVTNNSIVTPTSAHLDATGTGCNNGGGADSQGSCPVGQLNNTVINFNAQKNYLSSASNQYLTDSMTVTPTVTGNFCAGTGTFTGCTTTGFTTPPSAAFTLGTLSNGAVSFNTTTFTAQYGAVKWLASTSPTTPTSGDARWNMLPPVSLAVTHGSTAYLWTMDSANHISAPASALVP